MNTSLTVAGLRQQIGTLFRTSDFIPYLNQAMERVINSGLWKGNISYTAFQSVDDYFTLPYPYLSVIGSQWFRSPVPVFGQFHEFLPGGPGQPMANQPPNGIIQDIGDGYATLVDPPTAGSTLLIKPDLLIDSGKVFRFYGISNGREIFDVNGMGMDVVVNFPSSSVATVFDTVTGIQVPVDSTTGASTMIGGWTLYSVAPDATETQLGYYYPNETRPSYRRYTIGVTTASNTTVPFAVTVLVRRRFMPVFKETDWIYPGNVGALKFAMQAVDSESAKNPAQPFWDQCYNILNQELHALRGASRPEMNYSTLGGMEGFGNIY